jgi:PKD repeat protein
MKTNLRYGFKMMSFLFLLTLFVTSCKYENIVDVNYPDGLLYLPAAVNGVYTIEKLTQKNLATPTPGSLYQYQVNKEANRFEVPLGVFRSGVNPGGKINVDVEVNPSAVSELIANHTLTNTEILPADKYVISHPVLSMAAGADHAVFNISVDLAFLRQQVPQKYAFGVSISSTDQNVNPKLSTIVVLIDTKILIPEAQFTAQADEMDSKKIAFKSSSTFALTYAWNFGDGHTSNEENPVHAYETIGSYDVELIVTGLCGDTNSLKQTVQVSQ